MHFLLSQTSDKPEPSPAPSPSAPDGWLQVDTSMSDTTGFVWSLITLAAKLSLTQTAQGEYEG